MANDRYAYWREAVRDPENVTPQSAVGDIDGWYRITTKAKGKHMYPVVIWHDDDNNAWVKVGQSAPKLLDGPEGDEFRAGSWNWCVAVETGQYDQAFNTGTWWDGRAARKPPAEQNAPTMEDSGGGLPPSDTPPLSNDPPDIETWQDELEALKDAVDQLPAVIEDAEKATYADSLYQRLRKFWKKVDTQRAAEKAPHDTAAAAVQAKYKLPLLDPAETAAKKAKAKLDDFLRAEERRERAAAELARQEEAKHRETLGMEPPRREAPLPTAKIASGEGQKATSLRTRYVGVIENETKFINAIKKSSDFKEWLQNKANQLARAKTTVAGMRIEEER